MLSILATGIISVEEAVEDDIVFIAFVAKEKYPKGTRVDMSVHLELNLRTCGLHRLD